MKQPGAGPGCCDRRRLVAGCRPGSRYPPHLAFTLVNSSIFLVELLLKAKLCHNMNIAFMLPLIQSVPVLSQQPVNKSKTLQPFTLFTPFAPTYCRWDSTLLPNRFMGRPVIRTPPWKIGLKSVSDQILASGIRNFCQARWWCTLVRQTSSGKLPCKPCILSLWLSTNWTNYRGRDEVQNMYAKGGRESKMPGYGQLSISPLR